jgi:MFS family permease
MSIGLSRPLLALIAAQVSLHACMTGTRVAAPLLALREGQGAWSVGVLLAMFAVAPVVLALYAGRLADRFGYHRPIRIAVASAVVGGLLAGVDQRYAVLCVAALLVGGAANIGVIASQRTAGLMANDATQRVQIFSWLGLAPALANVLGPVLAGVLIDTAGFQVAFIVLAVLPMVTLLSSRGVPRAESEKGPSNTQAVGPKTAWSLLRSPALLQLLLLNWVMSASWDVHLFVLPVLGHERGLSASVIGGILGLFAGAVALVRLLIPLMAHRLSQSQVLSGAMLLTAAVFSVYPFAYNATLLACCAVVLGLALGAVQPMVMSTLHHITPEGRHGEVIALRSMVVNLSSTFMPLFFGLVGSTAGASPLFWGMAAVVAAGSFSARGMGRWARLR